MGQQVQPTEPPYQGQTITETGARHPTPASPNNGGKECGPPSTQGLLEKKRPQRYHLQENVAADACPPPLSRRDDTHPPPVHSGRTGPCFNRMSQRRRLRGWPEGREGSASAPRHMPEMAPREASVPLGEKGREVGQGPRPEPAPHRRAERSPRGTCQAEQRRGPLCPDTLHDPTSSGRVSGGLSHRLPVRGDPSRATSPPRPPGTADPPPKLSLLAAKPVQWVSRRCRTPTT